VGQIVPDISSISTCVASSRSVIFALREASVTPDASAIAAGNREGLCGSSCEIVVVEVMM
jgi:hypothetical protein